MLLCLGTVSKKTVEIYAAAVAKFELWCRSRRLALKTLADVDTALTRYMTFQYLAGERPVVGRNARFGWILLETKLNGDKAGALGESARALKGWSTLDPGDTRDPLPDFVCLWIASWFLDRGEIDAAAAVSLQLDTYARPSEVLALRVGDFTGPQRAAGRAFSRDWCVNLSNSEFGKVRKNSELDDTVRLGINGRSWIREVASALVYKRDRRAAVFDIDLPAYEKLFRQATKALQISALKPCPHAVRHAGPSHDAWTNALTLADIRKRGGWLAESSTCRYEKHGRLLRQVARLSSAQQKLARQVATDFPARLKAALRKRQRNGSR